MVSEETIHALRAEGRDVRFILGMRLRRSREVRDEVLSRAGRYQEVRGPREHAKDPAPLKVKEVWVGGHRYTVCLNEEEARKDVRDREAIVASLREKLRKEIGKAQEDFKESTDELLDALDKAGVDTNKATKLVGAVNKSLDLAQKAVKGDPTPETWGDVALNMGAITDLAQEIPGVDKIPGLGPLLEVATGIFEALPAVEEYFDLKRAERNVQAMGSAGLPPYPKDLFGCWCNPNME